MDAQAYFQHKMPLAEWPASLRLRTVEWKAVLSLDGATSAQEVQQKHGLGEAAWQRLVAKLQAAEVIEDAEMNYAEFARRQQGAKGSAIAAGSAPVKLAAPQFVPLPLPSGPALTSVAASRACSAPAASSSAVAPSAPHSRKLNLKSVMDFIVRHSGGDANAGQLAIYRVFMRVDTKLLRRNGVHSLRFSEDRLVADAELEQALEQSLTQALGTKLPESAFVAA